MSKLREFSKRRWEGADLATGLEEFMARDVSIHALFHGATNLSQVTNLLTQQVLAEEPGLLREQELNTGTLLQILSLGLRQMVIKSLSDGPLSQAEHLICLLARHVAQHQSKEPEDPSYQAISEQILGLYQQWDEAMRQQRASRRNMMR
ncbi:hypothetical protein SAMN04488540_104247 [Ferrimonas sediminum]|uniref:Uncharacterized protein n=1 Tax=Ferrimonas sediminum TaxID=718193 RepID=A0A1G8QBH5_9GAMM|nr:hypothetical protein [Ferrimonas sediminum]SDJ02122.1 hypothetical protein SAMN04488540_104247 [Ferrimonas sediminum]